MIKMYLTRYYLPYLAIIKFEVTPKQTSLFLLILEINPQNLAIFKMKLFVPQNLQLIAQLKNTRIS